MCHFTSAIYVIRACSNYIDTCSPVNDRFTKESMNYIARIMYAMYSIYQSLRRQKIHNKDISKLN